MNDNGGTQPDVLTVSEVASLLRCSKAHVCKAINGQIPGVAPIPAVRLGRRMLVLRRSLAAWLAQNQHGRESDTLRASLEIDAA
jgi:excisionase family DNA binding protein